VAPLRRLLSGERAGLVADVYCTLLRRGLDLVLSRDDIDRQRAGAGVESYEAQHPVKGHDLLPLRMRDDPAVARLDPVSCRPGRCHHDGDHQESQKHPSPLHVGPPFLQVSQVPTALGIWPTVQIHSIAVYQKLDIHSSRRREGGSIAMLLRDLEAFVQEHGRCGELDGGVEGDRVWMTCTCLASIARRVETPQSSPAGGRRRSRPSPSFPS